MTDDRTQGTADELKGRAREAVGDLTGDEDQQAKGQAEQAQGKGEKVVGDVKNAINDATGNN
jgi:uncharacterized protein YjbJ (UPF0337 family)